MNCKSKGRFLVTNHIWFEQIQDTPKKERTKETGAVNFIHGNSVPLLRGSNEKQLSLISDLSNGVDERIFSKTVRQEINRSKKDLVDVRFFMSNTLTEEILRAFQENYHEMYLSKGIKNVYVNMNEVRGYIEAQAFLLTVAYIEDVPVVFHSYVYDHAHSRLLSSCSSFRNEDKVAQNAIGRANKFLHWSDLNYFYNRKVYSYDWGGVTSFEDPNGIDKFKMAFGGNPVEYYNVRVDNSIKASILYGIRKWI